MILLDSSQARRLLTLAGFALGASQGGIAKLLGCSRRTVQRWSGGHSGPSPSDMLTLARHVYPVDEALAREMAAACHTTLEAAGIAPRPPPAPPPPAPAAPRPSPLVVDAVVCAAAEAADGTPRSVRPLLVAAFARAKALGLGIDEVLAALQPEAGDAAPRPQGRGRASERSR